jgi:hypothetical protein
VTPRVIFADADLVVVDKPSGMPSVPARTPLDPVDVAPRLVAAYGPLEAAHRLDRDTSGLLVLARSRAARSALGRGFEKRQVRKRYLAVVIGRPTEESGEICLPLAPDPGAPGRDRLPDRRRPALRRHGGGRRPRPARGWPRFAASDLRRAARARRTAAGGTAVGSLHRDDHCGVGRMAERFTFCQ